MDQKELDRVLENLLFAYRHYVQLPYLEIQQTTFDNHGGRTSTDACVCVVTHDDLGNTLDYITDLQQTASDLAIENRAAQERLKTLIQMVMRDDVYEEILIPEIREYLWSEGFTSNEHPEE